VHPTGTVSLPDAAADALPGVVEAHMGAAPAAALQPVPRSAAACSADGAPLQPVPRSAPSILPARLGDQGSAAELAPSSRANSPAPSSTGEHPICLHIGCTTLHTARCVRVSPCYAGSRHARFTASVQRLVLLSRPGEILDGGRLA
jgi:hypothetical protein